MVRTSDAQAPRYQGRGAHLIMRAPRTRRHSGVLLAGKEECPVFRRSLSVLIATGGALALSVVVGLSPALAAVPSGERTERSVHDRARLQHRRQHHLSAHPGPCEGEPPPEQPGRPDLRDHVPDLGRRIDRGRRTAPTSPPTTAPTTGRCWPAWPESTVPSVYGGGVGAIPASWRLPAAARDFNILWEPVAVMFNEVASVTHVTTLARQSLEDAGRVTEIRSGTPPSIAASRRALRMTRAPRSRRLPPHPELRSTAGR